MKRTSISLAIPALIDRLQNEELLLSRVKPESIFPAIQSGKGYPTVSVKRQSQTFERAKAPICFDEKHSDIVESRMIVQVTIDSKSYDDTNTIAEIVAGTLDGFDAKIANDLIISECKLTNINDTYGLDADLAVYESQLTFELVCVEQ